MYIKVAGSGLAKIVMECAIFICIYIHMYIHIYTHMYIYTHVYSYIYIHIYSCIYTHNIHIGNQSSRFRSGQDSEWR
jgi:hypothetical protein